MKKIDREEYSREMKQLEAEIEKLDKMGKDKLEMRKILQKEYLQISAETIRQEINAYFRQKTKKEESPKAIVEPDKDSFFNVDTLSKKMRNEIRTFGYIGESEQKKQEFSDIVITNIVDYILKNGLTVNEFVSILGNSEIKERIFKKLDEYSEIVRKYFINEEHKNNMLQVLRYPDSRVGADVINTKQQKMLPELGTMTLSQGKIDSIKNHIFNSNIYALIYMMKRYENHRIKINLKGYDQKVYSTMEKIYYEQLSAIRRKIIEINVKAKNTSNEKGPNKNGGGPNISESGDER